ncbi:glycosyltransferase [Prauserella cavernicola]|uniref:Glycosyltransferase n=1 Tax=Prauserella cavernicola TaxID=2800127 RepID=A0A934QQ87_9PSEU|nr:glycosyltransferase [Prauserella cavernicola]MBK1784365.1 glycosyltransferase [Prauserella cavernicola]
MPGKAAPATAQQPAANGKAPAAATTSEEQALFSEHTPQGRLLAQRGLFAGPSDVVSKDLYSSITEGVASRDRESLTLEPSAKVSGNTYFGRFPASYWQRWTKVASVTVEAAVTGSGQLSVRASDVEGVWRTVAATKVDNAKQPGTVSLEAKLDKFYDGGALWLDLETEAGERLTVSDVRWTVEPPEKVRPTAVTICTMNRADDCLANLKALADSLPALDTLDAIYVADQGNDTVDSRDGFAEVAEKLGTKLRYIKQPNLGGAGGFTRGLYEVAGHTETEHANVLFMDDDVLLEPDLVIRLTAFSNRAANPMIVGGQMLNLLHPNQLHVGAEYARLNTLEPGQPVAHSFNTADLLGVDHNGNPKQQERRLDAGYNGWWSCLIPYEVVKEIGYPMPFFFQWDDAEYSYRAKAHGFPTVTLPGAGVWHADFHWKDWDEWHRYFNLRNSIITAALHSPFDLNVLSRVLMAQLVRYLLGMQYGLSATLIKAVEDFLEGPEILHDGGVAAMKEIREIRAQYPETKRHAATDVPGIASNDIGIINTAPRPSMQRAVLLKRGLNRLLGKHRFALGAIPSDEAHWWHVSLFETAVVTDASQEGVRVRRYDRDRMFDLAKRGVRVVNRLRKEGHAVQAQYKRAMPELTSRDNWTRLYEL